MPLRAAVLHLPAERLIPAPDCGMRYIPGATAFAKLKALVEGAAIVRRELRGFDYPRAVLRAPIACAMAPRVAGVSASAFSIAKSWIVPL